MNRLFGGGYSLEGAFDQNVPEYLVASSNPMMLES